MLRRYDLKPISITKVIEFIKRIYPNIIIDMLEDCEIIGDEALTSVIDNIINNSITHGKTDKINIEVTAEENTCHVKIIDYGKGIPDSIKGRIFDEEFSYGESRGTGIGLYIAKKTIERYGGEIEVKDTKPQGATFILKLKRYK
ncbi:MAG: sensory histidine kinase AtoS [Candidatus Methanofastidiosum methylothiophilum]|uniref:Sensory histidine kinase AtoS n=1 Tax=Candidatus Methanofastidiosum methylothiophilum TaxID=1705564 RepID=A0A150IST0_9EURY|nr:MAG: sensory histidine kinase AtoS [Candidatus Methanofastidiosum methylthiophilus]KYC47915.1 MAG: sensory histidine kinase AtoS [Candidatus Methanofastidiosum methylthiophilus]KYC50060.1 MAG: sensory histidine kinase AtoS [Candidatus Methanofastidiosum methylthiophilus]